MMVTYEDLLAACPLEEWAKHRFQVSIDLVGGGIIIVRFDIKSLITLQLDGGWIRKYGGHIVLNKSAESQEAIAAALNQQMKLVASENLRTTKIAIAILEDVINGVNIPYILMFAAQQLRELLTPYQPHANNAGWNKFITLVEGYANQL